MFRFLYIILLSLFFTSCSVKSNLIQDEFTNIKKQNTYDRCANFSYISLSDDIKYGKIFTEYISLDSSCKWNGMARGYFVSLFMDTIKAKSYKVVEKKEKVLDVVKDKNIFLVRTTKNIFYSFKYGIFLVVCFSFNFRNINNSC